MADQNSIIFANIQGDHDYEKSPQIQFIDNTIKNKTILISSEQNTLNFAKPQDTNALKTPVQKQSEINKLEDNTTPNTSQQNTFILAKPQDANALKTPVQKQSEINKLEDNTTPNTSQQNTFILAKPQDANAFKIPAQKQSMINILESNIKPNTSQQNTFILAKPQDANALKTPVQKQFEINKLEDNTKPNTSQQNTFILAKPQDANAFKIPVQKQSMINILESNTKPNTSQQKTFIFAKPQDINALRTPMQKQSEINKLEDNTTPNTSQQNTFILAKPQDVNAFKIPVQKQSMINILESNTKPNTSQQKTFIFAKPQDINALRTPMQKHSMINKLEDNTKPNTYENKRYIFAKPQDTNAFKTPVQKPPMINKLEGKTKSNTSELKTFIFAKPQDINALKIPEQNQSMINKLEGKTISNTSEKNKFIFAKPQGINTFKKPIQKQTIINKPRDNSKTNTSEVKAFVFAKNLGMLPYKIPVQNHSTLNTIENNTIPNTSKQKTFILAKPQDINAFKVPVQNQSIINKHEDKSKPNTSEQSTFVFALPHDVNAFKMPVQNQSIINNHNDNNKSTQKKFVFAKFLDNTQFKIPEQNKTLVKYVEDTSASKPPELKQFVLTRDKTTEIPIQNKSVNNTTTVNSAIKMPDQQVLINKKIEPTLSVVSKTFKNEKSSTIPINTSLNLDKVAILKPNTSNITKSPSAITNQSETTQSFTKVPMETILNQTNTNLISSYKISTADDNNKQFSNLTQKLNVAPSTMTKSKFYVPHNGKNYMIRSNKEENSDIQKLPKLSPISSSLVKPTVVMPQSILPTQRQQNIIVSSSDMLKNCNTLNSNQFVARMEKLPNGKYQMLPAQGNIPAGLENLFKPTSQFIKHSIGTDGSNTPNENYFVSVDKKPSSSEDIKQLENSKQTDNFKKPVQVLPPKSQDTTISKTKIDSSNKISTKNTLPFTFTKKYQVIENELVFGSDLGKTVRFQGKTYSNQRRNYANQRKTYANKGKVCNPKKCIPSEFIKLKPNPETINQLKKQQMNSANNDSQDKPTVKLSLNEQGDPQLLIKVLKTTNELPSVTTDATTTVTTTQETLPDLPELSNLPEITNVCSISLEDFSNKKELSLSKKPRKSILKKSSGFSEHNMGLPPKCEYEYCDTMTYGLELIDNMYCSLTCKKFNTKLMLATQKKPVVRFNLKKDDQKQPVVDRKMVLKKLKDKINIRKKQKLLFPPEKPPRIDFTEHEKKSITIKAICEKPFCKSFRKSFRKSKKSSQSDDDEVIHYRPQIDHKIINNYIENLIFTTTPTKLFNKPFPTEPNLFRIGHKLEGIDPQHETMFCVMTVIEVIGYRIKLHFDGYSNIYDFWVNADYPYLFYPKWCEQNSRSLEPPKNYKNKFDWTDYLRQKLAFPAPKWNFSSTKYLATCPTHKFAIGCKLEALDISTRLSPKQVICVATVADVLGDHICIHFDGWSIDFDYWVDITSSNLHPVGWCSKNGQTLSPPGFFNEFRGHKHFSWSSYLSETNSKPVPEEAFIHRPPQRFIVNMAVEVVDIVVPSLLRIARVIDVKNNEIKIRYDGFDPIYDYWVENDSPNIHPVGWSLKTNHPLEIPAENHKRHYCGVSGCNGKGNKNRMINSHNDVRSCPYVIDNWKNAITGFPLIPDRVNTFVNPIKKPVTQNEILKIPPKKLYNRRPKKLPKILQRKLSQELTNELPKNLPKELPKKTKCKSKKQEILSKKKAISKVKILAKKKAKKMMYEQKKKKYLSYVEAHAMFGVKRVKSKDHWSNYDSTRLASIMDDMELRVDNPWTYLHNDDFVTSKAKRNKLNTRRNAILGIPNVNSSDVKLWSVSQVAEFVDHVVMSNSIYRSTKDHIFVSQIFMEKGIDGEKFLTLTDEDLKTFFNVPLGPALKISSAITILRNRVPQLPFSNNTDPLKF